MAKIFSEAQLIAVLKAAKAGGQFVTIYGESDMSLNKFPTDGSEKIRIKDNFCPRKRFHVTYNFAEDYEKAMAKALGQETYDASDANRIHLVKNVVMQYISTGNTCLIYIPKSYVSDGIFLDGMPISEADLLYAQKYERKNKNNAPVKYRTLSIKNVRGISIANEHYEVEIGQAVPLAG